MASRRIEDLDTRLQHAWQSAVNNWCNKNGLIPFLTCTLRSPQEQNADYAKGRTVVNGITGPHNAMGQTVTRARAFQSPHNFSPAQAFDFAFERADANGHFTAVWNDVASYTEFRQLILNADPSLISGATFKGLVDADHIETPDWRIKFANQIPK